MKNLLMVFLFLCLAGNSYSQITCEEKTQQLNLLDFQIDELFKQRAALQKQSCLVLPDGTFDATLIGSYAHIFADKQVKVYKDAGVLRFVSIPRLKDKRYRIVYLVGKRQYVLVTDNGICAERCKIHLVLESGGLYLAKSTEDCAFFCR